jgi:hypothetical protein
MKGSEEKIGSSTKRLEERIGSNSRLPEENIPFLDKRMDATQRVAVIEEKAHELGSKD